MKCQIAVSNLRVNCIIGALAREALHSQTIRVDLELVADTRDAERTDNLKETWNYAELCRDVEFILQSGRFYLLEAAGSILLRYLLLPPVPDDPRPKVESASVTLTKFGALPGEAQPQVRFEATTNEVRHSQETKDWGTVDVIGENRRLGLYRLNIAPGGEIPNHIHRIMKEQELVLSPGLLGWHDGGPPTPLEPGHRSAWKFEQPHGYRNPASHITSILCMDAPPFDPDDEIEVPYP